MISRSNKGIHLNLTELNRTGYIRAFSFRKDESIISKEAIEHSTSSNIFCLTHYDPPMATQIRINIGSANGLIMSCKCVFSPGGITPGGWINIKMSSYQYRKSNCGDKTILRPSYLHNGISYTGKMTSLYWIRAQGISGRNAEQHLTPGVPSCLAGG